MAKRKKQPMQRERSDLESSDGATGWIIGALVIVLVIIGLFYWGGSASTEGLKYYRSPDCVQR